MRIREEVLSVDGGEVILQWPSSISAEEIDDLLAWLDLIHRKIERLGRSVRITVNVEDVKGGE